MITIKVDNPFLDISYADLLSVDSVENLKLGFAMMGWRLTGKPKKAQIVHSYAEYVKANPTEVLYCLRSEDLALLANILKKGKGGHVTVTGVQLFNQLQKMNLVVSRENSHAHTTDFYLIDELYDLFAPHIEEAMRHPVDYNSGTWKKTPLDTVCMEISYKCNELVGEVEDWIKRKNPQLMTAKERESFRDALVDYLLVLEEYTGKFTSFIAATPQGFGERQSDIDKMKKNIKHVHDYFDHKIVLLDSISCSKATDGETDDIEEIDPEEKAQLEKVMQSQEFKDTMDRIKKDRMDAMKEAERAEREDGPVKFLPAFTKHPVSYPPRKESYCATRLVRPRVFEVTLPLDDGLYFMVYFNYMEQHGYTQATCYWGHIFDFAQKAVAEPYFGAGYVVLSKPFQKKYPYIAQVYGMQEDNSDCTKPYLTTIGWEGQPKEWFLSMRLYDFDFVKLITLSPLDCPEVIEAIDTLKRTALSMVHDIERSDARQPKALMKELLGL